MLNRRAFLTGLAAAGAASRVRAAEGDRRLLYVAVPGVRDYVEHGGVGILVYDMDQGFRCVKRIPSMDTGAAKAEAIKGICANAKTGRLYLSTPKRLACLDLATEKVLWVKAQEGGCDRMSITPDGQTLYLPSFEGPFWHVVDGASGEERSRIVLNSGAHNTIVGLDGKRAYLAGLKSPNLYVADTTTQQVSMTVGPFSNVVRPFTVNGRQTLCYVNVNELLGFEIGDLTSGKVLHRVEVPGFEKGPTKRHGCPSHGVALTPDEKELWLTDAHNSTLHVFDNTVMPPKKIASLTLGDQPGWVTFSLDGRYALPSSGEVIETRTRKILTTLKDENGKPVQSEKMMEIDFRDGKPFRTGDQFGLGRKIR